ncbi:putative transposon Ty5-1 protein YCL075W family [Cucumis melo var. makuwa]|uniref:Transposon Ty5-1 protein YCL075W family n=1 Tax=Cucumis melo var. makuwa TaxID=1194695 RepID=A0A5A7SUR3_CUCMM|nr:putative transposon Ty5-1 protein YCL075W family [Cucumis melo var. makuwa]TYK02344.1 putative transposon Ty5-1 protein YCL075W family [Cucumis melo var. makuwa]
MMTHGANIDHDHYLRLPLNSLRHLIVLNNFSPKISEIDAQLNPYFIHHSLGPTAAIVTQPLTRAINYTSSSRAMLMAISRQNKVEFITEKIKKPSDGILLDVWICNNDIIASWILNSISKKIITSIIYT